MIKFHVGIYVNLIFCSNDLPTSDLSNGVSDAIFDSPTLGMRCVEGYLVTNYNDTPVYCVLPGSKLLKT